MFISILGVGKNIYLAAKEYTVGRKACTIEIIDDATVSRKHCQFLVSKFQVTASKILTLHIKSLILLNRTTNHHPVK